MCISVRVPVSSINSSTGMYGCSYCFIGVAISDPRPQRRNTCSTDRDSTYAEQSGSLLGSSCTSSCRLESMKESSVTVPSDLVHELTVLWLPPPTNYDCFHWNALAYFNLHDVGMTQNLISMKVSSSET